MIFFVGGLLIQGAAEVVVEVEVEGLPSELLYLYVIEVSGGNLTLDSESNVGIRMNGLGCILSG